MDDCTDDDEDDNDGRSLVRLLALGDRISSFVIYLFCTRLASSLVERRRQFIVCLAL